MNAMGRRYWAVIVAAGASRRMGGGAPKVHRPLLGRPVLAWSLAPFLACDWIDGVVLVHSAGDDALARLPQWGTPRLHPVAGGAERPDSVRAGLERVAALCLDPAHTSVLVHDGARPCVSADELERLRAEANGPEGGLLTLPVTDTVKRVEGMGVSGTVDRTQLQRALTPQLFPLTTLQAALVQCAEQGIVVTDESSAMEAAGHRPRAVPGAMANLKITYAEDLALAAWWLQQREEASHD